MITKNIYDIPYPETTPASMDDVKTFFDDILLPFLAEKMGLVVRSDLNVMAPNYAQYSYVGFLAPSVNADPWLAVFNSNTNSTAQRYTVFAIAPVTKVENIFRPNTSSMTLTVAYAYVYKQGTMIVLQSTGYTSNNSSLVTVDIGDGRKISAFRTVRISDGSMVNVGGQGSIYFGNIKMNGNTVNTCVVMSVGFNTPWLEDYEQPASQTVITASPNQATINYSSLMGLIYSNNIGKEYLISLNLCIGEDAYVSNCLWYSDCLKKLSAGSVFEISNKKYVCVWPSADNGFRLVVPEEVN